MARINISAERIRRTRIDREQRFAVDEGNAFGEERDIPTPIQARARTRELLIVSAFALSIFFVRFDGFIVNLAMPTFVKILGIDIGQASWIALSYILMQVAAVMLFGKICDRFELKSVFMWGLAVFVGGSLLCV